MEFFFRIVNFITEPSSLYMYFKITKKSKLMPQYVMSNPFWNFNSLFIYFFFQVKNKIHVPKTIDTPLIKMNTSEFCFLAIAQEQDPNVAVACFVSEDSGQCRTRGIWKSATFPSILFWYWCITSQGALLNLCGWICGVHSGWQLIRIHHVTTISLRYSNNGWHKLALSKDMFHDWRAFHRLLNWDRIQASFRVM